jgi:NAD(P)-dependent dehydrogenase (short-subunit alcohol dehydrogenase family)
VLIVVVRLEGMSSMERFEGKTAIVTGASGGIGRAIVAGFVREGARVLALGRNETGLRSLADELSNDRLLTTVLDVRDVPAIKRVVNDAVDRLGRIHVLVNCAGVAYQVPVLEITPEQWSDILATNLTGAFFLSQETAKHMVQHGGGAIVNVSSVDAFIAESPFADYNASKAGLVQLTRSMAFELAHLGLRCNGVAPGFTATPMMDYTAEEATYRQYMSVIPMRRSATPEEQAAVVLFLASDESSYVNGVTIRVDGGMLQGFWSDPVLAPELPERRPGEGRS